MPRTIGCLEAVHQAGRGHCSLKIGTVKIKDDPVIGHGQIDICLMNCMVVHQQQRPWLQVVSKILNRIGNFSGQQENHFVEFMEMKAVFLACGVMQMKVMIILVEISFLRYFGFHV